MVIKYQDWRLNYHKMKTAIINKLNELEKANGIKIPKRLFVAQGFYS